jgi:hypothetical protein
MAAALTYMRRCWPHRARSMSRGVEPGGEHDGSRHDLLLRRSVVWGVLHTSILSTVSGGC